MKIRVKEYTENIILSFSIMIEVELVLYSPQYSSVLARLRRSS